MFAASIVAWFARGIFSVSTARRIYLLSQCEPWLALCQFSIDHDLFVGLYSISVIAVGIRVWDAIAENEVVITMEVLRKTKIILETHSNGAVVAAYRWVKR